MKKVGILTFHRAHNYGALLQTYALQKTMEDNGYDAKIIDYYNAYLYDQYKVFKSISKNPLKTLKHFVSDVINYRKNKVRFDAFESFINTKLNLTKNIDSVDYLITGSDQVWNRDLTRGLDDIYALNIDNGAIKISYAASVGDASVVYKNSNEYKKKLQRMDFISAREDSAAVALEDVLEKKIDVNLDPTLLLTAEQWRLETYKTPLEKGNYVFAYSVGRGNDLFYNATNKIAKDKNLKIVHFEKNNKVNKFKGEKVSWYKAGPLEFLNLLINSQYVVTSSFHGFAFSLLFHKNVLVIVNNKPERLLSLAKKVGAEKLIVNDVSESEKYLDGDILNWSDVDRKMEILRKKSISWLEQKISKGQK